MRAYFAKLSLAVLSACAMAFGTSSCSKSTELKAQVASMEQDLKERQTDIEDLRERIRVLEKENAELRDKGRSAEHAANETKNSLQLAQNDLEALRKARTADQERAKAQSPQQLLTNAKNQLNQQLAAVVTIEGDVASGRGFVVQADGKTWLYSTSQAFSGNTKLAVKDSSGTVLNKFGEFQMAADSSVVRLELQQDVPTKFEIAPPANIEPNANLVTLTIPREGGAVQLLECRALQAVGNDVELDVYGTEQSVGCPVIGADSGKIVGVLGSGSAAVGPLWPNSPDPSSEADPRPRVQRLNRPLEWKTSNIGAFLAERKKIDELNKSTRLLRALSVVRPATTGLVLDGVVANGNVSARQVLEQNAANPVVAELVKFNTTLTSQKVKVAERDINRRVGAALEEAARASRKLAQELKALPISNYHRPLAEAALKWQAEAEAAVAEIVASLTR